MVFTLSYIRLDVGFTFRSFSSAIMESRVRETESTLFLANSKIRIRLLQISDVVVSTWHDLDMLLTWSGKIVTWYVMERMTCSNRYFLKVSFEKIVSKGIFSNEYIVFFQNHLFLNYHVQTRKIKRGLLMSNHRYDDTLGPERLQILRYDSRFPMFGALL